MIAPLCPLESGGAMTEQVPAGGEERVARLIEAARDLVDAYRRGATANEHFQALQRAVDALGGAGRPAPPAGDADTQVPPVAT
jgi:hypothetical protein